MSHSFVHPGAFPEVIPAAHAGLRISRNVPLITTSTANPGEYQLLSIVGGPIAPILPLHQGAGTARSRMDILAQVAGAELADMAKMNPIPKAKRSRK